MAGLGFRVALLSSGETAALFLNNELFLGLRVGSSALVALVYCTFGIVLAWYKSHEGFAALTALTLLTTAITVADLSSALDVTWVAHIHPVFSALNTTLLLYLLLLFPYNRFRSRGSILLGHGWFLFCLSSLLFPGLPFNVVYFESWGRTPLPSLLFDFAPFMLAFWLLYRDFRGEAARGLRAQTKWFQVGAATLFWGLQLNFALRALPTELSNTFNLELVRPFGLNLLLLFLPLSLGVAHYRHGLFGGEVVVEHTLTYLTLAAVLVGFYVVLLRLLENFSVDYGSSLMIVVSAASFSRLFRSSSCHPKRCGTTCSISTASCRYETGFRPLCSLEHSLENGGADVLQAFSPARAPPR